MLQEFDIQKIVIVKLKGKMDIVYIFLKLGINQSPSETVLQMQTLRNHGERFVRQNFKKIRPKIILIS